MSVPSPGLAVIENDALLFGSEAAENARLKPRRVHSRFWQLLDARPLGRPFPQHLRTADLAHAHLSGFWRAVGHEVDEVILVVPGVYTSEQLALLLGITAAAGVPVRGMVDAAVAATADRATRTSCLHLDLHLNRTVLTELQHGPDLLRGRVWENDRVGLLGLTDLWARTVARLFVRETRLDPLRLAVTEQQLYLEIPRHVASLSEREATRVELAFDGRHHAVDLELRDVAEATRGATDVLASWVSEGADPETTTVLISDRLASLPLFVDRLRQMADFEVVTLHPAAACSAALNHAERIVGKGAALPLVTRLPGYRARPPGPVTVAVTPPSGSASDRSPPSHLVVDGVAQPITDEPIVIAPGEGGRWSTVDVDFEVEAQVIVRRIGSEVVVEAPPGLAVTVNGQPVEPTTVLAVGDRLQLGEARREVLLVTMVR